MDEQRFDPLDYVSVFNRRKWWFIVPVALSIVVGMLLVWKLPRTYQAEATIGVSSARIAPNLVGGVPLDKQDRLHAVSQLLVSRSVLEKVAHLEHLDARGSLDSVVAQLRSGVQVSLPDSITPGSGGPPSQLPPDAKAQLDNYIVTYTDDSPLDAQRIANRIVQVFVDENSQVRNVQAQDTSAFIEGQLRQSEQRLNTLEQQLRTVKESYMGRLPEQTNANLQMVSGLQRQLESTATTMRGEQDRLTMIERQIEAIQQGSDDPLSKATPVETAQVRVATLRRQLADAQLVYTDKHPEIMRLRQELADAEKAAAAERGRPATDRLAMLQQNPEYRQLLKDRDAAKMRIAELQRQQAATTDGIKQYQARVEAAPRVEQQMVSLQREYDLERQAYADLSAKKQAALLNQDMTRTQGGEQFAVVVPAGLPSEPFKPKPLRVMLMAIAAGFVLGGAGVIGREYLDRSVHDARGLRDEFELPVLAEIPRIEPVLG